MSVFKKTIHLSYFINFQKFKQSLISAIFRPGILNNNVRNYTAPCDESLSPSKEMKNILLKRFPKAKKIEVNDLSGGCGSMYEIFVETIEFKGLPLVKQHMLINETLKDQIKSMHGLTVKTKVADAEAS